jgi:hypothetical protein
MRTMIAMAGLLVGMATATAAQPVKSPLRGRAAEHVPIGITDRQAQTLPVRSLARLVLGAVGDLVVDVDRPAQKDAAPLARMTFYARPQWLQVERGSYRPIGAICSITEVTVQFSPEGVGHHGGTYAVDGLLTDTRFGLPVRPRLDYPTGSHDAACRDPERAYRAYFSAPDEDVAWAATRYIRAIAKAVANDGQTSFSIDCKMPMAAGACDRRQDLLREVELNNMSFVAKVECPRGGPCAPMPGDRREGFRRCSRQIGRVALVSRCRGRARRRAEGLVGQAGSGIFRNAPLA